MVFLIAQEAFKVVAYIYRAEAFKGLAYNSYINQAMKASATLSGAQDDLSFRFARNTTTLRVTSVY